MIKTVSSSLDLDRVLDGIVEIATNATGCHACFIYFLEGERLVLRAASARYSRFVGELGLGVDEGLAGWVARTKTPEFIRENAMEDPRMKYVAELEEERFQSMVAVPILAKAGDVIGVVVLHTEAPREFDHDVLNFLVHTASLVGGAIENAQLYAEARRRVGALTTLTQLSQALAGVTVREDLYDVVTRGTRELLRADACQIYRLDVEGDELALAGSDPDGAPAPSPRPGGTGLVLDLMRRAGGRGSNGRPRVERALWPDLDDSALLVAPLVARDEQLGVLCCLANERQFSDEDADLLGAVANLTAVGLKKAELIERLTAENIVKDMFDALAAGSVEAAEAKASEARCDLAEPASVPARRARSTRERGRAAVARARGPARDPPAAALSARVLRLTSRPGARARAAAQRAERRGRAAARGVRGARARGRPGRRAQRGRPRLGERAATHARGGGRGADRPLARRATAARSATRSSARTATSFTSISTRRRATAIAPRWSSSATTTAAAAPGWSRPWSSSSPTAAASRRARGRSTCTRTRCVSGSSGSSG